MRSLVTLILICGLIPLGYLRTSEESKSKTEPVSQPKVVDPLKPPEVKKGELILYAQKDYDVKEYKDKSRPEAGAWFKVKDGGWYIDWDTDRRSFETIVIHHSATSKETTADQIEKIQKPRLYAPRYASESKSPYVKGLPVHSGHVIDGKERFIG